jgi:hypothetical protein
MKTFLKIFITIFLTVGIWSCGSRKVQKSVETQKEVSTETVKIEEAKTDNTKISIAENTDELEVCPVIDSLPMVVNGITYKNARLRQVNKKVNTNIIKDIKETKKAVKIAKKKASTEIIKKHIYKKAFCWWWLLLLIIPIYYLYRKYKNLIWFI